MNKIIISINPELRLNILEVQKVFDDAGYFVELADINKVNWWKTSCVYNDEYSADYYLKFKEW